MLTHKFEDSVKGRKCSRVEECGSDIIFSFITQWRIHLLEKHGDESDKYDTPQDCPMKGKTGCGNTYRSYKAMNMHLKNSHSRSKSMNGRSVIVGLQLKKPDKKPSNEPGKQRGKK